MRDSQRGATRWAVDITLLQDSRTLGAPGHRGGILQDQGKQDTIELNSESGLANAIRFGELNDLFAKRAKA